MLDRGFTLFHVPLGPRSEGRSIASTCGLDEDDERRSEELDRGVPIRIHPSLLLFLPYVAFMAMQQLGFVARRLDIPRDAFHVPPLVWGIALAIGLFVAVLVHELAHCMVAIRSGARVQSITLMMLGGVSFIEGDLPPGREAWMAFAGPLASFAIAAVSYAAFRFLPLPAEALAALAAFAMTNAFLGAFNLLPAFPMDGGRVVRGLLARRLGAARATAIAVGIGRAMAVALALFAVWSFNLVLLLIAWFVYAGAGAERGRISLRHALEGVAVRDLMSPRLGEASAAEPVGDVLRRLWTAGLSGARVWGSGTPSAVSGTANARVLGVVTADDLEGVAERRGAGTPVTAAMDTAPRLAHPGDDAAKALEALSNGDARSIAVVDARGDIVGVVTVNELRRAAALSRGAMKKDAFPP